MLKITAICCTYKRSSVLPTAIECFLRQDYPKELRELVVLDDAGLHGNQEGPGWKIVSIDRRFRTLGEKRNASAALASPDTNAYCVWDDDDIYLPWHISAAAGVLEAAEFSQPSAIWLDSPEHRLRRARTKGLYHGAWAFCRTLFDRVHGYPFIQSGQDLGLLKRFYDAGATYADPLTIDPRPSYIYRWFTTDTGWHLSAMGRGGYERLESYEGGQARRIMPSWDADWVAAANRATRVQRPSASRDQKGQ
jgi:hypothetical protein